MAKVLESFSFDGGRRRLYPWHDWLDGRIWKLRSGKDFRPTARLFRKSLGAIGVRYKKRLHTSVVIEGGVEYVVMQAYPASDRGKTRK